LKKYFNTEICGVVEEILMKKTGKIILGFCLGLALVINITAGNESSTKTNKRAGKTFDISAKAWGPTQADVNAAKTRVENNLAVRNLLSGKKYRLLEFEVVERTAEDKTSLDPTHFRVYYYDYTNDKTILAEGDFAGKERISVRESDVKMDLSTSNEEIEAGFEVIKSNPKLGKLFNDGKLKLSAPMPPLSYVNGERLVNILIKYTETGNDEIVGVSFKNDSVVFYGKNAPPTGELGGSCGIPNSGQGSTGQGVAGQVTLTVSQSGLPLWEMLIVRPSASSGANFERSGVEVRDVKYKGKSVLKRGHAPILNVKYHSDVCGPFRDWQYSEGFFNAPDTGSQNPAPGIRILAPGQVATTAVESGNDTGNFQGVAIYQQDVVGYGNEVVLVSEMNAGWYRYIMEWRFAEDGTIRPRYGFGSVSNGCVCAARDHHVYWRFDFDIVTSSNNVYKVERGRKFLTPITTEAKLFRSYQTNRSILIQNSNGDEAYQLTPNITDEEAYFKYPGGNEEKFGAGDLWIMRYKGTTDSPGELDDPNTSAAANIDPWVNNESLGNNDAVVWYAAHQFRNDATSLTNFDRSGLVLEGVHVVGPDLRPVRW
jgi:hypothetical protein